MTRGPGGWKVEVLVEDGEYLGEATINKAEYTAIIRGMEACRGYRDVRVFSTLCINQINTRLKVREEHLRPLHDEVKRLSQGHSSNGCLGRTSGREGARGILEEQGGV